MGLIPTGHALGAVPARSPQCEALVTRVAARLEAHTEEIARGLVDGIAEQMDVVRDDEDIRDDLMAVARACAALLTAMTRSWSDPHDVPPPPDALFWARSLVARGMPMDTVLRVFRIGQGGYREVWHRELATSGEDPAVVHEALLATSAFTFAWVDAIVEPVAAAYEEERERILLGANAVRAETIEALLEGRDVDVRAASARLGYDLDRPHLAYIVWVETDADEAARDTIELFAASRAATFSGSRATRPLIHRVSPRIVSAWVARAEVTAEHLADARARARGARVRVAAGSPAAGVEGFRRSHDEARRARRVARLLHRTATVTRYEDVAVADVLTRDPQTARDFARATLGPLVAHDDASRRLLATLRIFFQEGQSFARTARRLGVHENTISYRVRRAAELTGQADPGSLVLRAAVELAPLLDVEPGPGA